MSETPFIILNGKIIAEQEAWVSPLNRGMMYGDGCFETLKWYSGSFLKWDLHVQRVEAGLEYLEISPAFTPAELRRQLITLIERNQLLEKEGMIRIQCWRKGERGYKTDSSNMGWLIQASEITPHHSPLKLTEAETRCIPSAALDRNYKLSNGLNYIKAAQEARNVQCDDALMLTVGGKISETTSANIFWVKDDQVFTPSKKCDLLPGITRELVIEVIKSVGIELAEGIFTPEDIQSAEAVFCTNSLIELRSVASLDKINFEVDHPLFLKIKDNFDQFKQKELS
jgi:branched-subunit amino acid aminotransferase/4-amino-4-deoxychorismate lyase